MPSTAIVDASALVAAADRDETYHRLVLELLERSDLQLIVPALPLAEAVFMVQRRLGSAAEAALVRGLARFTVEAPRQEDLLRMAELIEQYADFPLGAADASIVALAERIETDVIITLDRRYFGVVRPRHAEAFRILPE